MLQALARQKTAGKPPRAVSVKPMSSPPPTPTTIPGQTTITNTGNNSPNPTTPPRVEEIQPPAIRPGATSEIIFDPQIAAVSQGKWPTTWRPFVTDSNETDDYIGFTAGAKALQQLKDNAFNQKAPNYIKLKNTPIPINPVTGKVDPLKYTLAQTVIASLDNDVSREQLIEYISGQATSNPGSLGGLKLDEASKLINSIYDEFDAAQSEYAKNKVNYLADDKYYTAGIPHPKLKYGQSTNYKLGTIDIRTAPGVQEYFKNMNEFYKRNAPGASQAGGIAIDKVLKDVATKGKTPFKDEAIRRQDLYKAQIVQR